MSIGQECGTEMRIKLRNLLLFVYVIVFRERECRLDIMFAVNSFAAY